MILRPYQEDSVANIVAAIDPLVVAPTGSGKTVIVAEVIRQAENKFVLVIAHRRELIKQMRNKLAEFDITAGVILAGEPMNRMACVQVASIIKRCGRDACAATPISHWPTSWWLTKLITFPCSNLSQGR